MLFGIQQNRIDCRKYMQTVKREDKNQAIAFLCKNNIHLESESYNDDEHGVIQRERIQNRRRKRDCQLAENNGCQWCQ